MKVGVLVVDFIIVFECFTMSCDFILDAGWRQPRRSLVANLPENVLDCSQQLSNQMCIVSLWRGQAIYHQALTHKRHAWVGHRNAKIGSNRTWETDVCEIWMPLSGTTCSLACAAECNVVVKFICLFKRILSHGVWGVRSHSVIEIESAGLNQPGFFLFKKKWQWKSTAIFFFSKE